MRGDNADRQQDIGIEPLVSRENCQSEIVLACALVEGEALNRRE